MRRTLTTLWCVLILGMPFAARADVLPPDELIQNTVEEVMQIVKADKRIVSNQKRLHELVDAKILPHFDFSRMTQLAVGRSWRTATAEQKQALTTEFRTMLVRTYTKVFVTYQDPKVEVKPVKLNGDETEATVRTLIHLKGGQQTVTIDYEMLKSPTGWKAFDVTVEGVSLVTSYRGSFADQIQQTGIDGLIQMLTDKNLAASQTSSQKKVQSN